MTTAPQDTWARTRAGGLLTAGVAVTAGLASAQLLPAAWRLAGLRLWLAPHVAGLGAPGHVALTFDDGPHPAATPAVLEVLQRYRVRATFFLLGGQLTRYAWLGEALSQAGHELGVHGWDHRSLAFSGPLRTHEELADTCDMITTVSGIRPRWFRPPYGVLTASALHAAQRLGLTPVLWTAWGRDWTRQATPTSVLENLTADLDSGGTILLHDSDIAAAPDCWQTTVEALPALLEHCRARGWQVGPLDEHALPSRRPRSHRAGRGDLNPAGRRPA